LGLLSGLLSAAWGAQNYVRADYLERVANVFALVPELLPIGAFFGAALAAGIVKFSGRLLALPIVFVVTVYAWSAAIQVAIRTQRHVDDDPHLIAASLGAGAVGAGITHLGCAIFAPSLRRPARILATVIVGASAGVLLYASQRKFVSESWLYVVWQPAVAGMIGAGLDLRPDNSSKNG
jgi:hypothetical protein